MFQNLLFWIFILGENMEKKFTFLNQYTADIFDKFLVWQVDMGKFLSRPTSGAKVCVTLRM